MPRQFYILVLLAGCTTRLSPTPTPPSDTPTPGPTIEATRTCNFNDLPTLYDGTWNIVLQSNADVATLAAAGCQVLEQDLIVRGQGITSLRGLESLRWITADLTIDTTALTDLSGLDGLERIGDGGGGSLTIENNALITDLTGLGALDEVPTITVGNNAALTGLKGLGGVIPVFASALSIANNAALTSIAANISTNSIALDSNPALTTLVPPPGSWAPAASQWEISGSPLTDLHGLAFPGVSRSGPYPPTNTLTLTNNARLTSLSGIDCGIANDGMPDISKVTLSQNPMLQSVAGLGCFGEIDTLSIAGATALTAPNGLPNIVYNLSLQGTGVTSLGDFYAYWRTHASSGMPSMFGLTIADEPNLTDVSALDQMVIVNTLDLEAVPALTALPAITFPKFPTPTGSGPTLTLIATGLTALPASFSTTFYFAGVDLENNLALADISSLQTVALVGGDLRVANNTPLTSCQVDTVVAAIGASHVHQVQSFQNAACD